MADKKSCKYADKEYSHGATRCGGKEILECYNGEWINTHRPCGKEEGDEISVGSVAISSGVEINRIEGSPQEIKEISSEDEMPTEGLSRVAVVQCFNFSDGGSNSYVKLIRTANTSCESFMQCTVRWRQRDGDFIGDVKYRLQSGQSRYIRAYGWSGSIISEGKADLMRGQDVSDRLRLVSNNISGGVLWSLQNTTSKYAVFKIELYTNGNVHGYATGVIEPMDEVRVFWFGPDQNGYCILMLGRSEPD